MKLICGLGNPGKEYDNTRHNVGFMTIDNYCLKEQFSKKFNGLYLEKNINGEKVLFLKPQSYMNLSGTVVKPFIDYFKIEGSDILIIRDDLDLPLGKARIKFDSSSGGDNGIKSIINSLGNQKFYQFKIGISNDKNFDTKDYVLGKFSKEEREKLKIGFDMTKEVINDFIEGKITTTKDYTFGE
ncbi:MAG: aminoacyl-tRNA hydrolase [Bacilli bacterium]|nr:aminoacyl-tRNA hydrolase [Bacilli bacterium]